MRTRTGPFTGPLNPEPALWGTLWGKGAALFAESVTRQVYQRAALTVNGRRRAARASLRRAALRSASLRPANMRRYSLRRYSVRPASVRPAKLQHAKLRHASLRRTSLRHTILRRAVLPMAPAAPDRGGRWGRWIISARLRRSSQTACPRTGRRLKLTVADGPPVAIRG